MSIAGFSRHICATAGNHGHGTITAPEVIVPNAQRSLNACKEAWHMPISSVWIMTARSVSEKPSFLINGFGFIVFLSEIFCWSSSAKHVSRRAYNKNTLLIEWSRYAFGCRLRLLDHQLLP